MRICPIFIILYCCLNAFSTAQARLDVAPRSGGSPRSSPGHELNSLDRMSEERQDQLCADMKPGESQTVNESWRESPTGITRRYRVTRDTTNPRIYNVDLNLRFWGSQDYVRGQYGRMGSGLGFFPRHDETHRNYSQRTQECFKQMRGRLKDPDGNELHLNLTSDEKVPTNTIWVQGAGFRSNSAQWENNISCTTIIHEALHLMGLCDGYNETTMQAHGGQRANDPTASQFRYDCRSKEPGNSVMRDHVRALEEKYDILYCKCSIESCQAASSSHQPVTGKDALNCPEGYEEHLRGTWDKTGAMSWGAEIARRPGRILLTRASSAPELAPLMRAHTQTILKPRCLRGFYHRCASNAYRTRTEDSCLVTPPECGALD